MMELNLFSNDKIIRNMTFEELKHDVKVLNLNNLVFEFKELHHKLVTELNFKSYEKKLDDRNKPKLGNITRRKYEKIKALSDIIINDIFTESDNTFNLKKEKFRTLNQIVI